MLDCAADVTLRAVGTVVTFEPLMFERVFPKMRVEERIPVVIFEALMPVVTFEPLMFERVFPKMRVEERIPVVIFEALRDEMLAPFAVTFDATNVPVVTVAEFIVSVFM
jgi:hypothetical protein